MYVSNNYVVVEKVEEKEQDGGFTKVAVQDDFVYQGKITHVPAAPVYIGNDHLKTGDIVLFAKYSPDTHEIEHEGKKMKFISVRDLLAVL